MGNCLCNESVEEIDNRPLIQGVQGQKVERLSVAVNPTEPSVTLRWDPPTDSEDSDIRSYDVRFKKLGALHYSEFQVGPSQSACTLRVSSGLEPLSTTQFEVRVVQEAGKTGEWSCESLLVDWHCRLPTCGENRARKYDGQIYDFCGKRCAREYFSRHCMYPSCVCLKAEKEYYCSEHKDQVLQSDSAFVIEVDPRSDKFKTISKHFRKNWSKPKGGAPPKVEFIFKIINPTVFKQFEEYLQGVPPSYRKPMQLYHGTRLQCNMADFPDLCHDATCGVCCMGRGKLHPQEEAGGLVFLSTSSRAHDFTSSIGPHRAILMCKVVAGSRSSRVDAIDGDSVSLSPDISGGRQSGDVVVRNIDAVCPQYVILYTPS